MLIKIRYPNTVTVRTSLFKLDKLLMSLRGILVPCTQPFPKKINARCRLVSGKKACYNEEKNSCIHTSKKKNSLRMKGFEGATSQLAHVEKFSLKFSNSSFSYHLMKQLCKCKINEAVGKRILKASNLHIVL